VRTAIRDNRMPSPAPGRRLRHVAHTSHGVLDTGDDVIRSDDRRRDLVDCGPGHDTAYIDRRDRAKGCETVIRRAWSASHAHRP